MSTTTHVKINAVPKFDGIMFSLWKMQIMAYLDEAGLLGVVENPVCGITTSSIETIVKVEDNTIKSEEKAQLTQEQQKLMKKSMTAYNLLLLTLQNEQLHMVIDVPRGNAHGVWSALIKRYERKTVASKTQLRNQLYNNKLRSDESIDMYIARIKQIVLSLSDMGSKLSNDELIYILFKGLPSSSGSLIDILSTNDKLQFEEACTSIRDRQERIDLTEDEHNYALQVSDNNNNYNKKNDQNKVPKQSGTNNKSFNKNKQNKPYIKCDTCNEIGHAPYYCPQNKQKKKCDYCRKVGHTKQECYYLTSDQQSENESLSEEAHTVIDNHQFVF
jgi:hypothetical protein